MKVNVWKVVLAVEDSFEGDEPVMNELALRNMLKDVFQGFVGPTVVIAEVTLHSTRREE